MLGSCEKESLYEYGIFARNYKIESAERIQLVEDIWDMIAAEPDAVALTEAQKQELDQRLEDYHANPQAGSSWQEVRQRIPGNS